VASVYLDGTALPKNTHDSASLSVSPTSTLSLSIAKTFTHLEYTNPEYNMTSTLNTAFTSGTNHQLKVVTSDGGSFTYNLIAGSSG
jgi:hypothetical protein